jgi:hypothetical protein
VDAVNVGDIIVVNDYGFTHPPITYYESVALSSGPGNNNHFEIHVSQNEIDVYGTDAGTTAPLKKLASAAVSLSLTRGFIWMTDDHYNGDKFGTQRTNTFSWDNVGFDGPILPRDLAFDAIDSKTPASDPSFPANVNLGWFIDQENPTGDMAGPPVYQSTIENVTGTDIAAGALLEFYVWSRDSASLDFTYSINGNAANVGSWPFPQTGGYPRSMEFPVPLTQVVEGTNMIEISGGDGVAFAISNVDLVLVGGAGLPTCIDPSGCP